MEISGNSGKITDIIRNWGRNGEIGFESLKVYESPLFTKMPLRIDSVNGYSGPEVRVITPEGEVSFYSPDGLHIIGNQPPDSYRYPRWTE